MRQVGRFRLVAEIKQGDRITTYRGYDPQEERFVIVKVATIPATQADPALERLRKEGEIYRKMHHPNIARLIEVGLEGLYPYLVVEFVEGPGLRQLIRDHSPLPQDIALFCLIDLLEGLQFIHDNHLIHRDLKPENLILSTEGQLKICDFDLALENTPEATVSNRLSGTVGYFAPEAVLGEPLSPQSDLFSVGVIFYEMLTGVRPFKRESPKQEITAITQDQPLALHKVGVSTIPFLEELTRSLLSRDRQQRPESAAEVLMQIQKRLQIPSAQERQSRLAEFARDPIAYQALVLEEPSVPLPQSSPTPSSSRSRGWFWLALMLTAFLGGSFFLISQPEFGRRLSAGGAAHESPSLDGTPTAQKPSAGIDSAGTNASPTMPDSPKVTAAQPSDNRTGEAASAPARRQPQAPQTPPFSGKSVTIYSLPWAYVFIDGDSLGMTSDMEPVFLTAGSHTLTFVNPRLPRLEFSVQITPDTPDTLRFDLLPQLGQLQLSINPWAYVYVDGREIENFSSRTPIVLLPGEHSIRLIHPTLGSVEKRITLKAGELQRLSINLFEEIP